MVSQRLADLLIAQIQHELTAHQHYMAISLYFDRQSLKGWAKLFREQAMEEAQHADRIMRFLTDVDIPFDLPALPGASTRFESARAAIESALASEKRVTSQFEHMATVATEEKDFTGFRFLQWFLEEQVEEEDKMRSLLDLVDSGINLFQAQDHLEDFEEEDEGDED